MAAKKKIVKKSGRDGELTIVQVAHMLGLKYLRARDLMLSGKCGESRYDGRTLLVKTVNVERLRDAFKQHKAG